MSKVHNFSAGPCILAPEVLEGASNAVKELDNIGLSLIEISHRSKEFMGIMEDAQNLVREILNVPDNYSVLFLQGGASLGFYKTALNFMKEGGTAGYVNTGVWAKKLSKKQSWLVMLKLLHLRKMQISIIFQRNTLYLPTGITSI